MTHTRGKTKVLAECLECKECELQISTTFVISFINILFPDGLDGCSYLQAHNICYFSIELMASHSKTPPPASSVSFGFYLFCVFIYSFFEDKNNQTKPTLAKKKT